MLSTINVPANVPVTGPAGETNPVPVILPTTVNGANILFIFKELIYVIFVTFPPKFKLIPYLLFKFNLYSLFKFISYLLLICNYCKE
jgi:hypothetical protein